MAVAATTRRLLIICLASYLYEDVLANVEPVMGEELYGWENDYKENIFEDAEFDRVEWSWDNNTIPDTWAMSLKQFSIERVDHDANRGSHCLHVYDRKHVLYAPQAVFTKDTALELDTPYYASVYLKFSKPSTTKDPYANVTFYAYFKYGKQLIVTKKFALIKYEQYGTEYIHVGGDFRTPSQNFTEVRLTTSVSPIDSNYYMDTFTVMKLDDVSNTWERDAKRRINKYRKSDVHLKLQLPAGLDLTKTKVKVELDRHEFKFGTAIKAVNFLRNAEANIHYREFILKFFNCAVFENAMKWGNQEKNEGSPNFMSTDKAMALLKSYNMSVRGHATLWDVMSTNPNWLTSMDKDTDITDAVFKRVHDYTQYYRGMLYENDLCNEYLQKHYFEDATGRTNIIDEEFKLAHSLDPDVKLCLNDYLILRGHGVLVSNIVNLAKRLLDKDIPVGCIGAQSHLSGSSYNPDPPRFLKRLDILSSLGLDVSITEFSVHHHNVSERAMGAKKALTLMFSHPGVKGVNFWGFSNLFNPFSGDYHLTEGTYQTLNEAGEEIFGTRGLFLKDWHTMTTIKPTSYDIDETFSAFRGNYNLTVTEGRVVKQTEFFYVDGGENKFSF